MPVTSEKVFRLDVETMDQRFLCALGLSMVCASISMLCAFRLARRHISAGQRISGTLAIPQKAADTVSLIGGIPALAILSLAAVFFLELAPVWQFMETMVLASNFMKIPTYLLDSVGGSMRLQLMMKANEGHGQEVAIFAQPPCWWFKLCFKPKVPQPRDIPLLRYGVYQYCLVQPVLAFIELFIAMEVSMGAEFTNVINLNAKGFTTLKTISQLTCISACHGLTALVNSVNPSDEGAKASAKALDLKAAYCQAYIMALNTIPNLLGGLIVSYWGSRTTSNGVHLHTWELSEIGNSVALCVGTLIVTMKAYKAFPVDKYEYPELFQEGADLTESLLKLRAVKYCPFCACSSLDEEAGQQIGHCSYCGVSGIPLRLETR